MPLILRIISILFIFFGILSILLILLPIKGMNVNGVDMTYSELWNSGEALKFLFIDFCLLIVGIGFYQAKNWARYLVGFYFLILIPLLIFLNTDNSIFPMLIMSLPIIWYLFKKKSVVEYFEKNRGYRQENNK